MVDAFTKIAFTKIVFTQYYININDIFIFKISKLTDLVFYIFLGIDANSLKMVNNVRIVFSFVADPKISYHFNGFGVSLILILRR